MASPFELLVAAAQEDERVVGVILGGSRGKGLATEQSDWDVYVVVSDDADAALVVADLPLADDAVEVCAVMSVDALATYATPGHMDEWNCYNFAHVRPLFDRTPGAVLQGICDAKEWLPTDVARERAAAVLPAYINSYYRALKNHRDGNAAAARLDSAESVTSLLDFVFTAERRARPYNKFLAWELDRHPLDAAWWLTGDPVATLLGISSGVDIDVQTAQFNRVEAEARDLGFASEVEEWEDQLPVLRVGFGLNEI